MPGPLSRPMAHRGESRGRDWSDTRKVDIVHTIEVPVGILVEQAMALYEADAKRNYDAIKEIRHKVCRITTHALRYTGWQTNFNKLIPRNT